MKLHVIVSLVGERSSAVCSGSLIGSTKEGETIKAKAENDALQRHAEAQQLLSLSPSALPGAIKSSDRCHRLEMGKMFIRRSQTCAQVCVRVCGGGNENKCDTADFPQRTDMLPIFRNSSVNLSGSICHARSRQINEQLLFARMDLLMLAFY